MNFFPITDLTDLETLAESEQVEFKLAAGRDGKGALPQDFWSSYSAMANGRGGWVILGVEEKERKFIPVGVTELDKVQQDLFNQLNDRDRVSVNLLSAQNVQVVQLAGKSIMAIHIPAAMRKQKPVHLKKSPFGNTYLRLHDGDRRCDDETVKRMLAEQLHDSRDGEILSEHYDFSQDIDLDSLKVYRNLLSAHSPQHPYLDFDLFELFKKIGGWRKDRETGKEGITLAGVLMFGQWEAITAAAPNYFVDYQERPEAKTESRWVDRVCPDGTWSGNLFDFYRKVYQKLTTDLKVPFQLVEGQRKSDTPVHIALREALVNCLVHADYSERASVLVVKRPDMYGFRNPGLMRIPLEDVIAGGNTDCRNRLLHQMFLLIGLGERAGSGMPKIFSGWRSANWRPPKLWEKESLPQTLLELSLASLIPDETRAQLLGMFGEEFNRLDDFEQLIVTTAAIEGWVNHERACQLTTQHSREVTLALPRLEHRGFLTASGEFKQKIYTLPGVSLPTPDEVFSFASSAGMGNSSSTYNDESSTYTGQSSTYNDESSTYNDRSSTHSDEGATDNVTRDLHGRLISEHFDAPYIDDVAHLTETMRQHLFQLACEPRQKKRLDRSTMEAALIQVCQGHFVSISALASIVERDAQSIRQQYLKSLVDSGKLRLAFPQYKTHSKQGYIAVAVGH
ncbi:RNA-binding domain-containing protein [Aeromonas veronii]|uniref:RNA-binding domain-containing protein n=1 Tax=Aeromonas veronii TaxID=654 RepID=UPI00111678A1|nr:RNA-binding domain-containing protein [Aeromonas veronii]TNI06855.1 AAA family ATPase [Aeromonas veronii]HDO1311475.1 putative DNA binding domain-containing protein [Aeromonas veronii]